MKRDVEHRHEGFVGQVCSTQLVNGRHSDVPTWRVVERRGHILGTAYYCDEHLPDDCMNVLIDEWESAE